MKRTIAAALLLGLATYGLAGCSPPGGEGSSGSDKMATMEEARGGVAADMATAEAPAMEAAAPMPPPPPGQPPGPAQPGSPPGPIMLAYAWAYGVEAPPKQVKPVMKAHEQACADAGPARCQVLGASNNAYGEYDVRARLELRAEPKWLAEFRGKLEADQDKSGYEVKSSTVSSEDLTRAIVDTEARLRAQSTLRDRLQALLASRPGKLQELLEVERELARVQGDIDSIQSNLAVMRQRVAMSLLTIDYQSSGAPVTDTTFEPIGEAFENFARIIAQGFAAMITVVAVLLPWALLFGLLGWLFLGWRRKRRIEREAREAADVG